VEAAYLAAGEPPIDDVEVLASEVPAEQLVDVVESALAADLDVVTGEDAEEVLPPEAMAEGGLREEDALHAVSIASAIRQLYGQTGLS
jgi:hypothetical protein